MGTVIAELSNAKYVSFVSHKKDGSPVATPVWIVEFEDGYAFTTDPAAFKVKRVRNNPDVTIQVCTYRGGIKPGSTVHRGTAVLLDPDAARVVNDLVAKKYPIGMRAITVASWVRRILGKESDAADAAIKVTLRTP